MKLLLIVILAFLSGCSLSNNIRESKESNIKMFEDFRMDSPKFENLTEIKRWVAFAVTYKSDRDMGYSDYWQTPQETDAWKTGDCEDHAIYFIAIAYYQLHIKCNLAMVDLNGTNHAMAYYDGKYYETVGGYADYVTNVKLVRMINFRDIQKNMQKRK